MKLRNYLWLALLLLAPSCIPSLHPLYTPDTLVFETSLLGTWAQEDETYTFEKLKGKTYLLTYGNEVDILQYKVHLVQLEDYYYLDFYSHGGDSFLADDSNGVAPLIRTHSFARINWDADNLEIRHFAELEWLHELFEQRKIRIKHERIDDDIILTAGPKELQQFFLKYAEDPNIFTEAITLKKSL